MAVRRVVNGLICNGPGWRVGQDKTSVLGEHTHTHAHRDGKSVLGEHTHTHTEMGRVVLVSPVLA